jgi:PKD repeat protein
MINKQLLLKNLLGLFLFLYSSANWAQSTAGIGISWDVEVGCQTYSQIPGPRGTKDPIFLADILNGNCIKVCEGSQVNYLLSGNTANNTINWSVTGGTITNQSNTGCSVEWGIVGAGSIDISIINNDGTITKSICIEKISIPFADFTILPFSSNNGSDDLMGCTDQSIFFTNLSTPSSGTSLISYNWDFGDNTTSSAFEPTHVYQQDGFYTIKLIVTNSCYCTAVIERKIYIGKRGFEIQCPSVVCEGQSVTYQLPFDGQLVCQGNYNWDVTGGTMSVDPSNGDATVVWNHIDTSGFGFLTFIPNDCQLNCLMPSTIKVPVIQSHGTIVGNTNLCIKEQGRYSLPQWPTTDINWEIVGNQNGNLANVILTDQRNEVIIQPLTSGTITLRATYQNTLLHCGGSAEFIINISSALEFSGAEKVCQNTTETYSINSGESSNWTLLDSNSNSIATATGTSSFTYTFSTPGTYVLSDAGSSICQGQEKIITVVPTPSAPYVSGIQEVCPNAPYTYTISNPSPNTRYRWVPTNGNVNGSDIGNSVSISFNGYSPSYVSVYAETTSPIICSSVATVYPVNIKQINAEISSNFSSVCANSNNAQYQVNTIGTNSLYTEGESYNWSISSPNLGSISSGQGTPSVSVVWNNVTAITTATLTLTIQKCTLVKTITKTITILPLPHLVIAPVSTICSNAPITFTLSSDNGVAIASGAQIVWNFGYGNQAAVSAPAGLTQTQIYSNTTTANIGKTVTATITNPNGCNGTTNTASVSFQVIPSPPASASLSSSANTFCTNAQINATITAATLSSGVSIQWYNNLTLLNGATGTTLNVTPSTGFGSYTFVATNSFGCSTRSNPVLIIQNCGNIPCNYSPNPTIVNNATNNCGTLNLSGSATPAPQQSSWDILGPNTNLVGYTTSTFVATKAGEYHTFYSGYYMGTSGNLCKFSDEETVLVPYIPDFGYSTTCNGNSTFTIDFFDKTNMYSLVTAPSIEYSYKLNSASSFTEVSGNSVSGVAPGTYQLKISVRGFVDNELQPLCEKTLTIVIATVPSQSITHTLIKCNDTSIKFVNSGTPVSGNNYLWTFETGATNTLPSPSYVYTTSGIKTVTLTITNKYGCSTTPPLSTTFTVPPKCFTGDIVSVPNPPSVCAGQVVTINYDNSQDLCTPQYIWMNGNNPIVGAPNAPSIQVTTPGFYWVKVVSANNCILETPTRITPIFRTPPSLKIEAPSSLCVGENVEVQANTNAVSLSWYVDGILDTSVNNQISPMFYDLSVGDHTITCVATINGCSTSASQTITIMNTPNIPQITYEIIECSPYQVKLHATSNVSQYFTWSNGMSGADIEVTEGGPYLVRVTSGDCNATAQIDVPKNPENFMWIFPTGCYTACSNSIGSATLIGPRLPMNNWSWLQNGEHDSSGMHTFPQPYQLTESGTYNLELGNVTCSTTSAPLYYTQIECPKCPIKEIGVKEIKINETKFCSFNLVLSINSSLPYDIQTTITSPNNQVLLNPSGFTLLPGGNSYSFTVIPISTFTGGIVHLVLNGFTIEGKPCTLDFEVTLPSCLGSEISKKALGTGAAPFLALMPNPVHESVELNYKDMQPNSEVFVYDLTGRLLSSLVLIGSQGDIVLGVSNYPAGIYVVVVQGKNGMVMQQKFIKE